MDKTYLIGNGEWVNMELVPWGKEAWDYTYYRRDKVFRDIKYPMVIDLARFHPNTRFRTAVLGTDSHIRQCKRLLCYSRLRYPDWIDREAVLYFMVMWLNKHDVKNSLEDNNVRFWC